jgi:hypothetical protein
MDPPAPGPAGALRPTAPGESPPLAEGPVNDAGSPAVPLGPPACANAKVPDRANAKANAIVGKRRQNKTQNIRDKIALGCWLAGAMLLTFAGASLQGRFQVRLHTSVHCEPGGIMGRRLFLVLVLILAFTRVDAGCIDPTTLSHSTVSIARQFDDNERQVHPGVLAIEGTGWFLSPTSLVTVEHVAAAMNLSDQSWKQIEIRKGEIKQSIPARIRRVAGPSAEKIAVLELQTAFSDAQGFKLRMEPLSPRNPS